MVEGAAEDLFSTFMSREVLTPLGMERTVLEGTDQDADDVSSLQGASATDYGCFFGAGGYVSTPSDLVRLGSAMMTPGLLKAETITLFQTPRKLKSGASTGFALGWKVETIALAGKPTRVVRHRASLIGSALSLSLFPDLGLAVAIASSNQNIVAVEAFVPQIAEAFAR